MKQTLNMVYFFTLLFFSLGTMCAQDYEIRLKGGRDNHLSIELDDIKIETINFIIRHEPWDGRNYDQQVILDVMLPNTSRTMYMRYFEKNNYQCKNSYPQAIDKYLFDLDMREDGTYLVIRTLKIGDEFIIDATPKYDLTIENITLTYDTAISFIYLPSSPGYELSLFFKVSDNKDQGDLKFTFSRSGDIVKNEVVQEWKNFRFEMLGNLTNFLKMKVSKLDNEENSEGL